MQRQIRPIPFQKSLICIICCVIIAILTSKASAMDTRLDSSLSSFGLTEQQFEKRVKEYLGIPYRKGGTTRKGMDCSGFARTVYERLLGIDLPHNSISQFFSSDLERIDRRQLQTGDLIFFANKGKKKKKINHVGVYLSDGEFIHASSSVGITVSSLDEKYWKSRFVGSKRHLAMNPNGDNETARFEHYIEMPVSQNGTVTSYIRDEVRTNSLALHKESDTFEYGTTEAPEMARSHRNYFEVGYNYLLSEGISLNFNVSQERYDAFTAWPSIDSSSRFMDYGMTGSSPETAVRQGLKLSSDFHPNSWLSITPSITYFGYAADDDKALSSPKRSFAINTLLTPSDNNWSLSMLLQLSDRDNLTNGSTFDNKITALDLAFKLGINLSENLQFSIIGKHDKRTSSLDMSEDPTFLQAAGSNVFLTFDFSY